MSCTSEKWVPALFSAWEAAGIKYVVLRNYEKLPADTGNDLDLLVDPVRMAEAERILIRVMKENGALLHNRAEFSPVSIFFYDPVTLDQFHIDLFRDLKWRGFDLLRTADVLNRARRYNGMSVPSPQDEAVLNLITRLVFGGYVRDKYREPVRKTFTESPNAVLPVLTEAAGPLAPVMLEKAQRGDWEGIETLTSQFRKIIIRRALKNPLKMLADQLYDVKRLLARWLRTPGLVMVLAGPDGCGKTSVGVQLKERLAGTFYRDYTTYMHWKPRLLKKMADAANPFGTPRTEPHGKPARGPVMNVLYFLAHTLEIPPAWLLRVRSRLFRNKMVIIDRYYYDYMVDPRRYRMRVSKQMAWFAYRFMPKPDLVFCLTAPTEVIQTRKKEVAPEETERQRLVYEQTIGRLPYGHIVDTNRPLQQVVDEVEGIVLRYLADRTQRRMRRSAGN